MELSSRRGWTYNKGTQLQIQLVRNATMRFDYGFARFLTDPLFAKKHTMPSFAGKSRNPMVDLPTTPSKIVSGIEMVLLSHLHSDHFDKAAQ